MRCYHKRMDYREDWLFFSGILCHSLDTRNSWQWVRQKSSEDLLMVADIALEDTSPVRESRTVGVCLLHYPFHSSFWTTGTLDAHSSSLLFGTCPRE